MDSFHYSLVLLSCLLLINKCHSTGVTDSDLATKGNAFLKVKGIFFGNLRTPFTSGQTSGRQYNGHFTMNPHSITNRCPDLGMVKHPIIGKVYEIEDQFFENTSSY